MTNVGESRGFFERSADRRPNDGEPSDAEKHAAAMKRRHEIVDPATGLCCQELWKFREREAKKVLDARVASLSNDKWTDGDVESIMDLFSRLEVPDSADVQKIVATFLHSHNEPGSMLWLGRYLDATCGGPYEKAKLEVKHVWNVDHPDNCRFRGELGNIHFLMHGTHKSQVYPILKGAASRPEMNAPAKAVAGSGIYFQTNSLKAANFTLPGAYGKAKKADQQLDFLEDGATFYLFLCHVAMGNTVYMPKTMSKTDDYLNDIYLKHDSIVLEGLFAPQKKLMLDNDNIALPLGPFVRQPDQSYVDVQCRQICDDYVVRNSTQVRFAYLLEVVYHKLLE
ncbi:unnamed protein product [Bursaphelenchus xylophilus]|uniref:(pine wood nematode) hypothetical protein n=1 Tax=Bursaphelenchus xylophilus TaxID=6326 RepID=A0A7I8WNZ4_BURXY|nr:unnamed protein product [Bursaphelenchus xylophilus]CAG9094136.1 unnamed protein product [Bursaphelenchus xylophilus]